MWCRLDHSVDLGDTLHHETPLAYSEDKRLDRPPLIWRVLDITLSLLEMKPFLLNADYGVLGKLIGFIVQCDRHFRVQLRELASDTFVHGHLR